MSAPSNPTRKQKSPAFWAWTVSIAIHILILLGFAITRFTPAVLPQNPQPSEKTKFTAAVRTLTSNPLILPKPKVKNFNYTSDQVSSPSSLSKNNTSPVTEPDFSAISPAYPNSPTFKTEYDFTPDNDTSFFNSSTSKRRILYLVDASGSMKGIFTAVRSELIKSITSLEPDRYFYIIFFSDGITHFPASKTLVRAHNSAVQKACEFINTINPAGPTNAVQALQFALEIYRNCNISDGMIYFLSDGFDLTKSSGDTFPREIRNILRNCPPNININTIGFWPQERDKLILEDIARSTGADAVFVTDDNYENKTD